MPDERSGGHDTYEGIPSMCGWTGCKYPPAYSPNTYGHGPWLCRFHAMETDPVFSSQIVQMSYSFQPETVKEQIQAVQRAADAFCRENGYVTQQDRQEACKRLLSAFTAKQKVHLFKRGQAS